MGPGRTGAERPTAGERARRGLNFVAALVLLVLSSPLMLLVAFLVKATSPGPVLYNQPRVGLTVAEVRTDGVPLGTRPTAGEGTVEG